MAVLLWTGRARAATRGVPALLTRRVGARRGHLARRPLPRLRPPRPRRRPLDDGVRSRPAREERALRGRARAGARCTTSSSARGSSARTRRRPGAHPPKPPRREPRRRRHPARCWRSWSTRARRTRGARSVRAPPVLVDAGEFTYGLAARPAAASGREVSAAATSCASTRRRRRSRSAWTSGRASSTSRPRPVPCGRSRTSSARPLASTRALQGDGDRARRPGAVRRRVGRGLRLVANAGDGTVSRITVRKVVQTLHVGGEPNGLAAYRGFLYVSDHTGGRVLQIDPATNEVVGALALAGADWITALGDSLYVSQESNDVTRVDATSAARHGEGGGRSQSARLGDRRRAALGAVHRRRHDRGRRSGDARRSCGASAPAAGPIVALPAFGHTWVRTRPA